MADDEHHGAEVPPLSLPAEEVLRPLPTGYPEHDRELFASALAHSIAAVTSSSLGAVTVYGDMSVRRGCLLPCWPNAGCPKGPGFHARRWLHHVRERLSWPRRNHCARGLLITDWDSHNLFHWSTDVLSKVEALVSQGWDLQTIPIILNRRFYTPFARYTLAAYGAEVVIVEPGCRLSVDDVHVVPPLAIPGNVRPGLVQGIRQRLRSELPQTGDGPRRLFISRRKAHCERGRTPPHLGGLWGQCGVYGRLFLHRAGGFVRFC